MEQLRNTAREGECWQEPGWFIAPASLIHVEHLCRTISAPRAAFHIDWADPPLEAVDGDGDGGVTCLLWLSLCLLRDLLVNSMMATVRPSPCSSLGAGEMKLGSQCLGHNPQAAAEVVGSPPPSVSSRYWFCLLDLVAATGQGDLDALLGF